MPPKAASKLILFLLLFASEIQKSFQDLVLIHAMFRHGDRTTDERTIYPNDPYANETYPPYGLGQLTNRGKLREYNLGQYLRNRYDDFLGEIYTPELLEPRSTYYNRTKMSLELVLAGLFPPKGEQIWHPTLNWQPIPYNYVPVEDDKELFGLFCPSFEHYLGIYFQTEEGQNILGEYQEDFQYLSNHTGANITDFDGAAAIYFGLRGEEEWGFELPEWSKSVYPELLTNITVENYLTLTATPELRQLMSGYFLKKLINDTTSKLNHTLVPEARKLFLYSAHEITIATLLSSLNVFKPHVPDYGSCLIFEIHQINEEIFIKLNYETDLSSEPEVLVLPECEELCLLDKFISLVEPNIADESLCG